MKLALALLLVLFGVANAAPNPWGVEVPAGFEQQAPEIIESALAPLRAATKSPTLVGAIYLSRENQSQLTIVRYNETIEPTRTAIVDYDKHGAASAAKEATKHISDSRTWDGDQLVSESIDEMGPARVQMKKRYALDAARPARRAADARRTRSAGAQDLRGHGEAGDEARLGCAAVPR